MSIALNPGLHTKPHSSRRRLLVGGIVAIALTGWVLASFMIVGWVRTHGPAGKFAMHQTVPTSFGSVSVQDVTRSLSKGHSAHEKAHGLLTIVPKGTARVSVFLTIANGKEGRVAYSPIQFHLKVGENGPPLLATASSFGSGLLNQNGQMHELMTFMVPAGKTGLWLEYRDPNMPRAIDINLGVPRLVASEAVTIPWPSTAAPGAH